MLKYKNSTNTVWIFIFETITLFRKIKLQMHWIYQCCQTAGWLVSYYRKTIFQLSIFIYDININKKKIKRKNWKHTAWGENFVKDRRSVKSKQYKLCAIKKVFNLNNWKVSLRWELRNNKNEIDRNSEREREERPQPHTFVCVCVSESAVQIRLWK